MTRASGQRVASPRVCGPGPQPRSTTISGAPAPTREVRSAKGRRRWWLNFSYCSGFHVSNTVLPIIKYLDIKILDDR